MGVAVTGHALGEEVLASSSGAGCHCQSCVAVGAVEALVISAPAYGSLLREHHIRTNALCEKIKFVRSLPLFAEWSMARQMRLAHGLDQRQYAEGEVIYEEGTAAESVYFTRGGLVRLCVRCPELSAPATSSGTTCRPAIVT